VGIKQNFSQAKQVCPHVQGTMLILLIAFVTVEHVDWKKLITLKSTIPVLPARKKLILFFTGMEYGKK
jgi:hypothetical protein